MNYFEELITILNEMSAYLLLGFLISGLLHVYVPKSIYSRFLQQKGVSSVFRAALLGVPLPLCSCGVIPTAVSLKKEGASDGAAVSFLVATPQTGVDSILATYSLLGLPFSIIRPIASFFVAIFGGVLVDTFGNKRDLPHNSNNGSKASVDYANLKFQPEDAKQHENCGCGCSHEKPKKSLYAALRYAYVDLMQDFGKWLVVGLLVAAAITAFVPESLFTMFESHYMLNILLILLISTPMYICATGSTPVALSLMLKGVSPGAALVLLMVGPATNFASVIILKREIGLRKTIIYLISIVVGAVACALIVDFVLPQEWFSGLHHNFANIVDHGHDHCAHDHCSHGPIWWQTATSVLFIALFTNSLILQWRKNWAK